MEGRDPAKGNPGWQNRLRTQSRASLQSALDRVRQAAISNPKQRFTALWHHVYNPENLRESFQRLNRKAAPGVDGETWKRYAEDLEEHLPDLSARLKRGAYRARPVKRTYVPKADGRQRPIGITVLEDKLVQAATVRVLNAVYEPEFLGFSYGFRPGRSQHDALDALHVGIEKRKVGWVLDADIQGFFDAIDHEWLVKFIEHRIADKRVVRHVKKWLNAGVFEDGEVRRPERGTPQGGSISPVLANVYLHHAFDLWADDWRRRNARGNVILIRYADDIVVGFQHRSDAVRFFREMRERLARFRLTLHPVKTRLIEFGRFAAERRARKGLGKPETFDFLGFTHICGETRRGRFVVRRRTMRKRLRRKLQQVRLELRKRMHWPLPEVGRWLASVLSGHFRYYGVPLNFDRLTAFRFEVVRLWKQALSRRSQRTKITWERMKRIAKRWLPSPRIVHPWPRERLCVNT